MTVAADQNVAAVAAIFEEFSRHESDRTFATYDEAVVWDARSVRTPELNGVFYGHEGIRTWWRNWLVAWESIEITEGPEHRAHGNQVVSIWKQHNRGKGSGVEVPQEAGLVFTFLNGKIVHAAAFMDCADALRAAGLDP